MCGAEQWGKRLVFASLSMVLLVACGSGSDTSFGFSVSAHEPAGAKQTDELVNDLCDEISGGDTQVSFSVDSSCLNCSAQDEEQAIDGLQSSAASIEFANASDGPWTVRASAQEGVVFGAGSNAAVVLSAPESVNNLTVLVTTYLDGVEQDSDCEPSVRLDNESLVVVGTHTSQPYDAVELQIKRNHLDILDTNCSLEVLSSSNPHQAAVDRKVKIHEFCNEFRLPE